MKKNWNQKLTPAQHHILREKGTEPPFSGTLLYNKEKGMYCCAGCGAELFSSATKFDWSNWVSNPAACCGCKCTQFDA